VIVATLSVAYIVYFYVTRGRDKLSQMVERGSP